MNSRDSSRILETDSSVSILDIPCSIREKATGAEDGKGTTHGTFSDPVDAVFADYNFIIPGILCDFLAKTEKRFVYRLSEDKVFRVVRREDSEVVCSMDVFDFWKDDLDTICNDVVFVVNREKYRRQTRTKQNNEYRAAIEQGVKYHRKPDMYIEKTSELHRIQIRDGINFIFLSKPQDLLDEMRFIAGHLSCRKTHVPRTKVFGADQKTEHLQHLLQSIPGIGRSVARSLSLYFKSIKEIHRFVREDTDESMKELRIWDEGEQHSRPLGESQSNRIKAVFGDRTCLHNTRSPTE